MNCEQATQLISLECEQKLHFLTEWKLKFHLWLCPKCRYFKNNNDKLRYLIKARTQSDKR